MRWTRHLRLWSAGAVAASALCTVPAARAAEPHDGLFTDLVNLLSAFFFSARWARSSYP
ncbi:hypothetical protein QQY66_44830 [Streptomyces sp. DG2A-72]|uniref:hypothetical protein n=1 Tax=Streptomyces sp. DG2A-72 TaxID=3051386 RepID=UPI00265BA86F|nr:hypothetical protein [Streptomyces sp. DG2A-72]MDO0938507.1 hypothetical protein [Streptomyces sp. DG2A-72]